MGGGGDTPIFSGLYTRGVNEVPAWAPSHLRRAIESHTDAAPRHIQGHLFCAPISPWLVLASSASAKIVVLAGLYFGESGHLSSTNNLHQ